MSSLFRKPTGVGTPGKAQGVPVDERAAKKWPTLFDFLTQDAWPDGEARERGCLILFYEGDTAKICLSDKAMGATLWATDGSLLGVLDALEGRLTEDKPDWRAAKKKK